MKRTIAIASIAVASAVTLSACGTGTGWEANVSAAFTQQVNDMPKTELDELCMTLDMFELASAEEYADMTVGFAPAAFTAADALVETGADVDSLGIPESASARDIAVIGSEAIFAACADYDGPSFEESMEEAFAEETAEPVIEETSEPVAEVTSTEFPEHAATLNEITALTTAGDTAETEADLDPVMVGLGLVADNAISFETGNTDFDTAWTNVMWTIQDMTTAYAEGDYEFVSAAAENLDLLTEDLADAAPDGLDVSSLV